MTETLNELETRALRLGEVAGFQALGPLAERHGSWEIVLWKNSPPEDLDRFVSLAVTEVGSQYEIELRAGAEHQGLFARTLVEEFGGEANDDLWLRVGQGLERAMAVAEGFHAAELADTYLPERFQAQRGASAD